MPIILLLFILIFSPLIEGGTTHLPVTVIRLTILFLSTYWFITGIRKGVISFPRTIMDVPIIFFAGLSVASLIWSPYTAMSLQWVMSIISYAIFFYLLVFYIKRIEDIRLFLIVIIAMGLFEAALVISQFIYAGGQRPRGTFFNPNFLAGYMAAIAGVVLGIALWGTALWESVKGFAQREERHHFLNRYILNKAVMLCILGTLSIGILLTASRGGILSFLAVVSFILLFRFRYKAIIAIGILALLVLIVPNPLKDRIKTLPTADPYAYTRLQIWNDSIKRILDYPFGAGLGIFKYTSQQSNFPVAGTISRYGKRAETAHSEYLQMAMELGIVGLLIFIYGVYRLFNEFKSASKKFIQMQGAVIGAAGGITGILTHAAVDSNFHEPSIVLLLILLSVFIIQAMRITGETSMPLRGTKDDENPPTLPLPPRWGGIGWGGFSEESEGKFREVIVTQGKKRFLYLVTTLTVTGCAFLIIRPAMAWYLYQGAESQVRYGKSLKAIDLLRFSTLVDPGNTAYHDHLAEKLMREYVKTQRQEYIEEAIEEINYAVDLNSLNGKTLNHLGTLYQLRADHEKDPLKRVEYLEKSIEVYKKAIALDPYSVFNYDEIARVYIKLEKKEDAIDSLKKAISLEPNYLPARELLARIYFKQTEYDLADREYSKILDIYKKYHNMRSNGLEIAYMNIDLAAINQIQMSLRDVNVSQDF